ncbi:MAG TPA: cupredoxin family copper-binding protein [Pyrinomonadaceae bacterium]
MNKTNKTTLRTTVTAIVLIGLGLALAGCKTQEKEHVMTNSGRPAAATPAQSDASERPAKGEVQIVIENFAFSPADVTVAPGTKVTWINKDDAPHTATSVDKKFNSGGLDTDDKFSFMFNDKGEYQYICTLHPQMRATIKVK